jgi:PKD repeat protein
MLRDFNAPECSKNLSGLAVGETTSWTCSHAGETASYYNIISAMGWSPLAGKIVMWNDSARVNVVPVVMVDIVPVSLSSPVLETPVIENEPAPDTEVSRPEADFIADLQSGYAPLTVTFTDLSTGNPDNWYWDFGHGSTSTGPNQEHSYLDPGTFTVTLTVSNAHGNGAETMEIIVSAPTPPVEESTPLPEIQVPTGSPGENNVT